MQKEKPILFSTPMVKAILEGGKIQTRRLNGLKIINENPDNWEFWRIFKGYAKFVEKSNALNEIYIKCPYDKGDLLWLRETHYIHMNAVQGSYGYTEGEKIEYPPHFVDKKGIKRPVEFKEKYPKAMWKWRPSIFMPKTATRIWLEVTNVEIERLHDISKEDAISEGIKKIKDKIIGYPFGINFNYYNGFDRYSTSTEAFCGLWIKINGEQSWNDNPFVWKIEFKIHKIKK